MLTGFFRTLAGVCLSLFLVLFAGAAAAQTLGQPSGSLALGNTGQGQSFTATVTGTITQIQVRPHTGVVADTLRFYNGTGSGVANAAGVAAYQQTVTSVTASNAAPLQTFVLTTPFPIVAGNTYSFIFDATILWHAAGDPFAGGSFILDNNFAMANRDLAFQVTQATVAAVPTMSEWAMILFGTVLAGGAALYLQRRRMQALSAG